MDQNNESIFATLMRNLMSSPDAQGKVRAAEELTKATIADHGFLSFYEYLNGALSDEIEAIELFSRIVLTRPRIYTDFRAYLLAMKQNFQELMSLIIKDDVIFGNFITKLFYSMRTHNLENDFDFFYAETDDAWLCLVFKNLCSRQFYLDELKDVYLRNYKTILLSFNRHKSVDAIECGLLNLQTTFDFWLDVLPECNDQKIFECLFSFKSKLPQSLSEALIFQALFNEGLEVNDLINSLESFSAEFLQAVNAKIESGRKANHQILKTLSQKVPTFSNLLPTEKAWIEEIIDDLMSSEPAVIAHGLYLLRKEAESTRRKQLSDKIVKVADLCSQSLFHDDTYVFMNAVKLFQDLNYTSDIKSFSTQLLANFKSSKNPSLYFPRVVEVFSAWIERKALPSSATQAFIENCKPMLKSDNEECRISAINALNIICSSSPEVMANDYKAVFSHLALPQFEAISADLETQALFSFIDTFLSAFANDSKNRFSIEIEIYGSIDDLCRRALKSPDSSVKSMAINNLMKLEHLRRF